MSPLPLAHFGHFVEAVPFVMPCVMIVVWLLIQQRIDKRRDAREGS